MIVPVRATNINLQLNDVNDKNLFLLNGLQYLMLT